MSRIAAIHPLTASRWNDVLKLFGPGGACMGCWCQYWRTPRAVFRRARAAENKAAFQLQARSRSRPPGLIGYTADGEPAGWVSLGPRGDFPGLQSGRFFGDTTDDSGLWSVVCFYVPARHRGCGVSESLLAGAVAFARRRRARVLEAYPWDLDVKTGASSSLYVGTRAMFERAGFSEVSRKVPHRPIMRLRLKAEAA